MGGVQLAVEIRLPGRDRLAVKGDNDAVVIFWRVFGKPLGGGVSTSMPKTMELSSRRIRKGPFPFRLAGCLIIPRDSSG